MLNKVLYYLSIVSLFTILIYSILSLGSSSKEEPNHIISAHFLDGE